MADSSTLRTTPAEKRLIEERASRDGVSSSEWVRRAVEDYREKKYARAPQIPQ